MSIDVLLTYPADGLRLFQSMIPIGLVSIGTVLRRAGYEVRIIDFNHYARDFRRDLLALRPKVIGIGGTTPTRRGAFLTARIAKETLPGVPVVYGGVHATFTSKEVLENIPDIDFVIEGEGEWSFLALCNLLTGNNAGSVETIPGACYRGPGGIVRNKPQRIDDLSALPIPDRDLLPHDYRIAMDFIAGRGDYIMTSRGCPAACNFCSASRMFPHGVRFRNIDTVAAEVEYLLSRKTIAGLKVFDSTFTAGRDHTVKFCDAMRRFKLPWECEIRADTVDFELLKIMKESGCYYINVGMETANPAHLKRIAKGISAPQVLGVLETCKRLDIRSKVFFTFGHVGQTFGECLEDIRFIEKNRTSIDFFAVTVGMRVYPGTRLERTCREAGLIKNNFSWVKRTVSWRNLWVLEPGDIPILFQKGLGPRTMALLIGILLFKKLICTEGFIFKMVLENGAGLAKMMYLQACYTYHRTTRLLALLTAES
jgi:anaerobic magnesium-protoporphyrin IX monomethyl ester cyclase